MKRKLQPLLDWLKSADEAAIAETGTTRAYLRMIGYGQKFASAEMSIGIELATAGLINRQMLRPVDWGRLWPELAATMTQTIPANAGQHSATGDAVNSSSMSEPSP